MRKVFFEKLEQLAKKQKDIFLLVADLGAKFFQNFNNIDKKRFINVGVAESNMIGVAAGLALSGKNPYCYSIIPFLTMRTLEQIRVDLCYNDLNVKLLGAGGGLVYGAEGITHHAIEDIAMMRSLPNMTIVAPGDAKEAQALAEISVSYRGPLFVRFGRDSDPVIHKGKINFRIGKGIIVEKGKNVCIMATGSMLAASKEALCFLKEKGINATLISMHTIKPLDNSLIRECAKEYKFIFSVEEHSVFGGLGGAMAEVLSESGYSGTFKRIGIEDKYLFPAMGGIDYLRKKAGLDSSSISKRILKLVKK